MQFGYEKLSPTETRKFNSVLRKLKVDEASPIAMSLALGFILPFLRNETSVNDIEKALRPIWPLYTKSVESIDLSLD